MLSICHLYPDLLNLYGDRGNIMAFHKRCLWRKIPVKTKCVSLGEDVDFSEHDFVLLGGGSDREQNLISSDLMKRRDNLQEAIENGLVVLAICGGYQLLGGYYLTREGESIPGLDILDFYTQAGDRRMVGNIAVEVELGGRPVQVVGFENHSGQTFLGGIRSLGKVLSGNGNNGRDGLEGARYKNVFCSYLHGPLLPKNNRLTDALISLALRRRGLNYQLKSLDDDFEDQARGVMFKRMGIKVK